MKITEGSTCLFGGMCFLALTAVGPSGCGDSWNYSSSQSSSILFVSGRGKMTEGSGQAATESRTVGDFQRLQVDGIADVEVQVGGPTAVAVTSDDNLLPLIVTKTEGDTLHIYTTGNLRTSLGIKVKIATPALEGIATTGAGSVRAAGLAAKDFTLDISGVGHARLQGTADSLAVNLTGAGGLQAGDLAAKNVHVEVSGTGGAEVGGQAETLAAQLSGAGGLDAPHLAGGKVKVEISGTGGARLAGKADTFSAVLSGAGHIRAPELVARAVTVDVSGVGGAEVCATDSLDATVSGVGSVSYSGHPAHLQKNVSGIGSITAR